MFHMFYVFICFANVLYKYQEEWQVCGRCLEIMIIKSSKFTTVGKHSKPRSLQSWCVSLLKQILIDSQSNNKKITSGYSTVWSQNQGWSEKIPKMSLCSNGSVNFFLINNTFVLCNLHFRHNIASYCKCFAPQMKIVPQYNELFHVSMYHTSVVPFNS